MDHTKYHIGGIRADFIVIALHCGTQAKDPGEKLLKGLFALTHFELARASPLGIHPGPWL